MKNVEANNENNLYTILIIILCIFLFISGLTIGICFYYKNIRKKRKNELDENYEYMINDDKS